MTTLILIGLALGLDSFRVSLSLGMLKPSIRRQATLALAFGFCDGLAPLVGLAVGRALTDVINTWAGYLGLVVMGLYGLYVFCVAWYGKEAEVGGNGQWVMFGLPLCLSVDNLVVGVGLGVLGYPVPLSPGIIGVLSGLMSFGGLRLGRAIGSRFPFKAELVGGVAMLVLSVVLAVDRR
jgi:manganese efflux pump family protein